jgi:hypothetical protein
VARNCKGCISPHRAELDALMSSGASGTQVIARMEELDSTKWHHSNLATHRPHVQSQAQDDELDRLQRELEAEARAAPATVAVLYRMLARGVEALKHGKLPTIAEMTKIAQAISQVTGINQKTALMMAYANRAFGNGRQVEPTDVLQLPPVPMDDEQGL